MHRTLNCPNKRCEGTWTFEGKVVKGNPRSRHEAYEPSRFEVDKPPYAEDPHTCGEILSEMDEAEMILVVEEDPVDPEEDYDPCQEELWER